MCFVFEGGHRLICGDATDPAVYAALMQGVEARFVLTDEPYNVPIAGHVTKGDHREFEMASGEMSDEEFLAFNKAWIGAAVGNLCDGGLIGTFIDWRGYPKVDAAALATRPDADQSDRLDQDQWRAWEAFIGRSTSCSRSTRRARRRTSTTSSSARTAAGARMSGIIPAHQASARTVEKASNSTRP